MYDRTNISCLQAMFRQPMHQHYHIEFLNRIHRLAGISCYEAWFVFCLFYDPDGLDRHYGAPGRL